MKNFLFFLVCITALILLSCDKKVDKRKEQNKLYYSVISDMRVTMEQLGNYQYNPSGNDSIWEVTDLTYSVNLIEKVFSELLPLEKKWDSLMFLAKKYDTVPLPSDGILNSSLRISERKVNIMKWKLSVSKLVDRGIYDRNGKKLK
ncbi:hypothetical protein [Ulvibacter antarcticus]|uniref:Lipoprotein n=1 Tax=Ulvibacter antarcticus TaxID=442714 RepID=A0A3L9YQ88_9FLAO|nr:hypothetical protein [Ulvibacter antarcticus]RMA56652.1 hypothetical protein BXY75_3355 [Ulvibacter antarcticus]